MDKECGNCKHWQSRESRGHSDYFGKCELHSWSHGSLDVETDTIRGGYTVTTPEDFYCSDHEEQ